MIEAICNVFAIGILFTGSLQMFSRDYDKGEANYIGLGCVSVAGIAHLFGQVMQSIWEFVQ